MKKLKSYFNVFFIIINVNTGSSKTAISLIICSLSGLARILSYGEPVFGSRSKVAAEYWAARRQADRYSTR